MYLFGGELSSNFEKLRSGGAISSDFTHFGFCPDFGLSSQRSSHPRKFTSIACSPQRKDVIQWIWWYLKATINSYHLVYDTCLILVFRRLRGQMNAGQNAFFEKRPLSSCFYTTSPNTWVVVWLLWYKMPTTTKATLVPKNNPIEKTEWKKLFASWS